MAFDYTALYPDTSSNGSFTKSWNYTTVADSVAVCSASGYFNKVATRLGIGDNIVVVRVDAFDKSRTTLVEYVTLYVTGIAAGVVTTAASIGLDSPHFTGIPTAPTAAPGTNNTQLATTAYADAIAAVDAAALALKANIASPIFTGLVSVASGAGLGYQGAAPARTDFLNFGGTGSLANAQASAYSIRRNFDNVTILNVDGNGLVTAPTLVVTGGSVSVSGSDANFNLGGNRVFMDASRMGSLNGGGAANGLTVIVNNTAAITFSTAGVGTFASGPLAPTAAPGTNNTQLATTAYADAIAALKANLASPTFTGTPAAPTAAVDTNTTQIATTAMVLAQAAAATPLVDAVAAVVGTSTRFARGDHVHPLGAVNAATPANPTGTTSTVGVMMGLGAAASPCTLTPNTTRVLFGFHGTFNHSSADPVVMTLRYGTGAAPANGAAATGTVAGVAQTCFVGGLSVSILFGLPSVLVTGLTAGTAYWFDIQLGCFSAGTAGLQTLVFSAVSV